MQKTSDLETTPPAPFEPVPRPRVLERIRRAAARRIVLVVAPAGFGKSVAVRQYLEADNVPHLRFSVRKEHATLVSFLRGFVAALDPIAPNASKSVAGAYEKASRGGKPLQHLANWVAALLSRYNGTIFIDDLHLAEERAATQLLGEIIDHTGESLKWIISTRELTLPHASWLAYGDRDEAVDENDLRMTLSEATLACKAYRVRVSSEDLAQMLALTEGWPVALAFALRASARLADLRLVTAGTREITYNYLADQVLRKLSDDQRRVLFETCLFVRIDSRILSQLSDEHQAHIEHLRRQATFIVVEGPATYRYHDLFRDFLEHELRSMGTVEHSRVLEKSASVLLGAGYYDQALALHLSTGSRASIEKLLLGYGWRILEAGAFDRVAPALAVIGSSICANSAILLSLLARIEEGRGRFDESDRHYKRALEIAIDSATIARISEKWAVSLLNRFMLDEAYAVVHHLDITAFPDAGIAGRVWAVKSAIEALRGKRIEANEALRQALRAIGDVADDETIAVVYHFASYVHLWSGKMTAATDCAVRSLDLSRELGMYDLAGRTCSVLYEAAGALDDQKRLEWCLDEISRLAALSGDPLLLQYALFCRYDSAVERGDFEAAEALELEVDREQAVDEERWAQTVLAADAMRAACAGDFLRAFSIGSPWRLEKLPLTVRALRAAELALYASGAQMAAMADEISVAETLLDEVLASPGEGTTVRARKAAALVGIAMLFQERSSQAVQLLDRLGKTRVRSNGVWSLLESCRMACRYVSGEASSREFTESLKRLDASRFAGYARLLRALPIWKSVTHHVDSLTAAELKVLQLLSAGYSSKEIGCQLGRSRLTIDTHVKAILRKLQCTSRREAVARFAEGKAKGGRTDSGD